jgi:hypothetical protein
VSDTLVLVTLATARLAGWDGGDSSGGGLSDGGGDVPPRSRDSHRLKILGSGSPKTALAHDTVLLNTRGAVKVPFWPYRTSFVPANVHC